MNCAAQLDERHCAAIPDRLDIIFLDSLFLPFGNTLKLALEDYLQ